MRHRSLVRLSAVLLGLVVIDYYLGWWGVLPSFVILCFGLELHVRGRPRDDEL